MNLIKEASASCGSWPKDKEQYKVDAPQEISQKCLQTLLIWMSSFTLKKLTSRLLVSLSSVERDTGLASSMTSTIRQSSCFTESVLCLTTLPGPWFEGRHLQRLHLQTLYMDFEATLLLIQT